MYSKEAHLISKDPVQVNCICYQKVFSVYNSMLFESLCSFCREGSEKCVNVPSKKAYPLHTDKRHLENAFLCVSGFVSSIQRHKHIF